MEDGGDFSSGVAVSGAAVNVLVVIPLYNHAASVRDVVRRVLAVHDRVLVVDDGSTDDGVRKLDGLPLVLLSHPKNQGKGAAILTAAREARRLGMSHIVTIDADGQHAPEELPEFMAEIRRHPGAILVGTRDFINSAAPFSSRFGRAFSNFWLRLQTGTVLGDSQSGFRAYPLLVFSGLRFSHRRYAFEVEVLVKAAWADVELRDLPISVVYPPKKERVSHFDFVGDNLRLTLLNTVLTLRSAAPWPHRGIGAGHFLPSLRRFLVENSSPSRLAAAAALGVFLGTLPLIAVHTMAILLAAGFLRLNKMAAVGASQLCMPPLVPALCIEAGYFLRNGGFLTEFSLRTLGYQGLERLYEWLLGSLLLAPLFAALVFGAVYATALCVRAGRRVCG